MNKKFTVVFGLIGALAVATIANSRTNRPVPLPELISSRMISIATTPQDAEELIRAAEVLLAHRMFSQAEVLVTKAHELNPTASRVAFYHAGFIGLKGLAMIPDMRRELKNAIGKGANSYLGKRFKGNRFELQRRLRTDALPLLIRAAEEFRNISGSLHLHVTGDTEFDCTGEGELWECRKVHDSAVDSAVIEANRVVDSFDRQILVGYLWSVSDFIRIFTAYSLEGYEAAEQLQNPSVDEITRVAPRLGTLNNDHELGVLQQTTEAGAALTFGLFDLAGRLGYGNGNYRQNVFGHVYFSRDAIKTLRALSDLLRGPKPVKFVNSVGRTETIMVDIARLLKNPPKDLKRLFPESNGAAYPDPTIGGLFPDGDVARMNDSTSVLGFLTWRYIDPLRISAQRVGQ